MISNWANLNQNYSIKSWELDTLSKRIISWIANSNYFYHEGNENFKINFTKIIKKQLNHLINEIENTELVNDKMIGKVLSSSDNQALAYLRFDFASQDMRAGKVKITYNANRSFE